MSYDRDRLNYRPAIFAALLALALYAITLGGTYVYDDMYIVREDPRVINTNWREVFTKDYNHGGVDNLYRPLVSSTYVLQWQLHGDKPWAFHLVNWLLHALASALVAMLGVRLISTRAGYVAGLLFAAHPIHVEAVANIVGRAELMCAAGMLGALLIFINKPLTTARAIAIFACFLLALGSKEQAMLLPAILLVADRCIRPRSSDQGPARQLLIILLCFTLAGFIVLREQVLKLHFYWDRQFLDWSIQPMLRSVGVDRWLMPFVLLGHYVQLLFFPWKLSPDYGGAAIGWTVSARDPYLYLGFASAVAGCSALVYSLLNRKYILFFCLVSFALTYGVVSNFITIIGTNFGERLMYLPSVFFLLMIAMPLQRQRILVAILLILASIRTFTYAREWNDRLTFYRYAVETNPKSVRLYMLLADEQMKRGDLAGARETDAEGRKALPDYWDIWVQSARVEEKFGNDEQALIYLKQAFKLRTNVGIASEIAQVTAKMKKH